MANSTSAKQQREERPAKKAGEFVIGNDLRVTRLILAQCASPAREFGVSLPTRPKPCACCEGLLN